MLKIFPDHWNGWQKGAVLAVAGLLVLYALSLAGSDDSTDPGARRAQTSSSRSVPATTAPSTYEVRYVITTKSAQYVDLVYNNATGGIERRDDIQISGYKPKELTYQMERGEHAYIAIYTRRDASRSNPISCEILVNGERLDFTEVSSPSALAACSAIVGR